METMQFIYDLISALIIVISTTGLFIDQLKKYQYIILILYVMSMVELGSITGRGQIIGVVMAPGLFIILALFIRKNRGWNLCLGCVGYLINITFNNLMIYVVSKIGKISVSKMSVKYWLQFSIGYIVLLGSLFYLLRKCLIKDRYKEIEDLSQTMASGMFVNLMLFIIVFIMNISMGEQIGYSVRGIRFNIILFAICLLISSLLFGVCIKTIKKEEEQKAQKRQMEILNDYIKNLEQLNEKTIAFRHDYKNILSGLSGYLKDGKIEEMKSYLSEIIHTTDRSLEEQDFAWKELKYIYPLELKGFLYEKMLLTYAQKIKMEVQIDNQFELRCSYMNDIIRILGIFIDNAIEETANLEDGYIIIMAVNSESGGVFSVINNYKKKPDLALMQQKGYSTKGEGRGMGLYWAEEHVKTHEIIHNVKILEGEIIQEIEIVKE